MKPLPPIAAWLREQRRLGKYQTLRQVARYAELSPDTVARIYRGDVPRPEPETLLALARFFKVPRDELMAIAGYVTPSSDIILMSPELNITTHVPPGGIGPDELDDIRAALAEAERRIKARRERHPPD